MAVLHLLSNPAAAASCLDALAAEDSLLLIGEGVFALSMVAATVQPEVRLAYLADDAQRLGVAPLPDGQALSYPDFVTWVVECERSVTWT